MEHFGEEDSLGKMLKQRETKPEEAKEEVLGGVSEGHWEESVTSNISNFYLAFTLLKDNGAERSSSSSVLLSDFLLLGTEFKLVLFGL